jgi:hypothetical protein
LLYTKEWQSAKNSDRSAKRLAPRPKSYQYRLFFFGWFSAPQLVALHWLLFAGHLISAKA